MFSYYGGPANTDSFFRAFWFPGVAHVSGGAAPQPPAMFDIMVNWVENGVAPDYVVASQNLGGGVTRTRKICKYPNEGVYTGSGSSDDQANWVCQVNAQIPATSGLHRLGEAVQSGPIIGPNLKDRRIESGGPPGCATERRTFPSKIGYKSCVVCIVVQNLPVPFTGAYGQEALALRNAG